MIGGVESGSPPGLTIELGPQTCWFSNVRDQVSPQDWDRIRRQVYENAAVVARFVVDEAQGTPSSAMRFGSTTRLRVSSAWFG